MTYGDFFRNAPQNIEEYIAQQPENVQPYLRQIHDAIKKHTAGRCAEDFLEYADLLEKAESDSVCGIQKNTSACIPTLRWGG